MLASNEAHNTILWSAKNWLAHESYVILIFSYFVDMNDNKNAVTTQLFA